MEAAQLDKFGLIIDFWGGLHLPFFHILDAKLKVSVLRQDKIISVCYNCITNLQLNV